MTWARTGPKYKKEKVEEEADDNDGGDGDAKKEAEPEPEAEPESEEEAEEDPDPEPEPEQAIDPDNPDAEKPAPKKKLSYKDKDLIARVPDEKHYKFKMIETLAMSASKTCKTLKTFIIVPGLIYGNGETVFYEYFRVSNLNNLSYNINYYKY